MVKARDPMTKNRTPEPQEPNGLVTEFWAFSYLLTLGFCFVFSLISQFLPHLGSHPVPVPNPNPHLSAKSEALDCILRGGRGSWSSDKVCDRDRPTLLGGVHAFGEPRSSWLSKFSDLILKDDQHGSEPLED